ncbi:MAG: UDP-N-acetylglucosamine 2-epimerase [bacterium]|nr:UDP-N-acetylglucosamine 2-epimerase [bacterium]
MSQNQKRKICVVNGKRGGFNALLATMKAIDESTELELQVLLTDMHLSKQFGYTLDYAKKFINVSKTVPIGQTGASALERTEALGRGLTGIAAAFAELEPDIVLLLGDRSETLVAAFAALQLKIPVAHIQGGEVSGNIDGIQRHAITKLSHIHFTETELARQRVLKLGEELWRVHNFGAPYMDFLMQKLYTPESIVREKYGLKTDEPFLLVLQHPVTTEPNKSYAHMKELLSAVLDTKMKAIIAYPCSDQGYQGIVDAIEEERENPDFSIYKNIPAEDFIGLQATCSALLGNSSAAIYEAPYIYCPAVNIGRRQFKREKENNVFDAEPNKQSIKQAIDFVLNDEHFKKRMRKPKWIYGDGNAYKRIVNFLRKVPLDRKLFEKKLTYYSLRRQIYDKYFRKLYGKIRSMW